LHSICFVLKEHYPILNPNASYLRYMELSKSLKKTGNKTIIIMQGSSINSKTYHDDEGNTFVTIPGLTKSWFSNIIFFILLTRTVKQIITKYHIDTLIVNSVFSSFACLIIHKFYPKIRILYDIIGIYELEIQRANSLERGIKGSSTQIIIQPLLRKILFYGINSIITVNQAHKEEIKKLTRLPIYILRDAYDIDFEKHIDLENETNNKSINILYIGSIYIHRLEIFFKVAQEILNKYDNLKIIIVGNGPDKQYFENMIKSNKEKYLFYGYIPHSQIAKIIANSDICFSDCWSRIGFPVKVFEYMAMGKAIICEDTSSVREILSPNKNALLYQTSEDLYKQFEKLINNQKIRNNIGSNAIIEAKKHTWDQRAIELIDIIN